MEIIKSDDNSFKYIDEKIIVNTNFPFNSDIKSKIRDELYKDQAKSKITPLVYKWEDIMKLKSTAIKYRKTKRQWGSCSSKNNISLNTYLCLLPVDIIEYVIVHELSHIVHKNHSKDFWSLVESYLPNYKDLRLELKKYSIFLK